MSQQPKKNSPSPKGLPRRPLRSELPPEANLCEYCAAKCCRYFALPIDLPETFREYDFVRWFILHERATVFVSDGTWYLLVLTKCRNLRDDNLCGQYETRPQICRDYTTENCEYEDSFVHDQFFEVPEQVEEYATAMLGPRPGADFRSPRPKRS